MIDALRSFAPLLPLSVVSCVAFVRGLGHSATGVVRLIGYGLGHYFTTPRKTIPYEGPGTPGTHAALVLAAMLWFALMTGQVWAWAGALMFGWAYAAEVVLQARTEVPYRPRRAAGTRRQQRAALRG